MSHTPRDRALALAGLFQAAQQVDRLGRTGDADESAAATIIESIFRTEAETTEAVYGSAANVRPGLELVMRVMTNETADAERGATRYAAALMHLDRKLARRDDLLASIGKGIDGARHQLEHYGPAHPNLLANLADVYVHTVGQLGPRIIVTGDQNHLKSTRVVEQIRSLLLGGIRSAVLWRQVGGSRLKMILGRSRLVEATEGLLEEAA